MVFHGQESELKNYGIDCEQKLSKNDFRKKSLIEYLYSKIRPQKEIFFKYIKITKFYIVTKSK